MNFPVEYGPNDVTALRELWEETEDRSDVEIIHKKGCHTIVDLMSQCDPKFNEAYGH
jgi:hypothetical protein